MLSLVFAISDARAAGQADVARDVLAFWPLPPGEPVDDIASFLDQEA